MLLEEGELGFESGNSVCDYLNIDGGPRSRRFHALNIELTQFRHDPVDLVGGCPNAFNGVP